MIAESPRVGAQRFARPPARRLVAMMLAVAVGSATLLTAVGVTGVGPVSAAVSQQTPDSPSGSPAGSDSSDVIRGDTERILERKEFSYEKGYLERFLDWLGRRLRPPEILAPSAGGAGGLGGLIGTLIAWAIVLGAVTALVFVLARYVRRRTPKAVVDKEEPLTVVEAGRSVKEWNSDAERHEAAGEWKQAIRARYRLLVRELTDRGRLPDVAGTTTRELRAALAETTPLATEDFDSASTLFELPWYAAEQTGPEEIQKLRQLSEAILEVAA